MAANAPARRGSGLKVNWNKVKPQQGGRPTFHKGNQLGVIKKAIETTSKSGKCMYQVTYEVLKPAADAKKSTSIWYVIGTDDDPMALEQDTIDNSGAVGQLRWLIEKAGGKFKDMSLQRTLQSCIGKQVILQFGPKKDQSGEMVNDIINIWAIGEREIGIDKDDAPATGRRERPADEDLDAEIGEASDGDAEEAAEGDGTEDGTTEEDDGTEDDGTAEGSEDSEESTDEDGDGTDGDVDEGQAEEEEEPPPRKPVAKPPVKTTAKPTTVATKPGAKIEAVMCPLCKKAIEKPKYKAHVATCEGEPTAKPKPKK